MQDSIKNAIWDQMALARDMNVYATKRHDDGAVSYRVSFVIDLPAEVERKLEANARAHNSGVTKRLRQYAKFGLKVCFADEDSPSTMIADN